MAKILLVEDDKSLREIYGVRLMAEGYTITSAGDGEEALAVAIKERPDLIVSDVMMPKISGFDMLDILRSTTETKDIKVIMMTALSSEDQRARGEALGADRYLVKSQVGIEDVVRTVHDVLGDSIAGATPTSPTFPPATAPIPAPVVPEPAPAPAAAIPAPFEPTPVPIIAAPVEVEAVTAPAPFAQPVAVPAPYVAPTAPPVEQPVFAAPPVFPSEPFAPTAPATQPATLPEPTAPFSSNPPASLGSQIGDRIINPLPSADSLQPGMADIASQMNQELNAHLQQLEPLSAPTQPPAPIQPQAPVIQPPQPPVPPQPGL